ncbi:MAG TPA: prepilin-type N-terminal cleavage/methylation domain-containing protein, partial [Kiritimatiellia bacterium]|nr:prepilin-type N-terminal cleavage/methylation domain-containing protein [Kiritimatiellia bacterium]
MNTRSEKRAAFTLIELLVVIGIIGVLSAMI